MRFTLLLLLMGSPLAASDELHLFLKGRWHLEDTAETFRHVVRFTATRNSINGSYTDHRGIQKKVRAIRFDGDTLTFNVSDFDYTITLTRKDTYFVGELWDRPADKRTEVAMRGKERRSGRLVTRRKPAKTAENPETPTGAEVAEAPATADGAAAAPAAEAETETVYLAEKAFVLKGDWLMVTTEGKKRRWYLSFSGGMGDPRGSWITPQGFERNLGGVRYNGDRLQFTIKEKGIHAALNRDGEMFSGSVLVKGETLRVEAKPR